VVADPYRRGADRARGAQRSSSTERAAAAHDRISAALRDARERADLSEQEVVDLLAARGVSISTATLERWERTGGIRLEEAVDLAAVYDISLDDLARRRGWNGRFLGSVERTRSDSD
jgi:transcriptional regulator with XRE-family HTH domain